MSRYLLVPDVTSLYHCLKKKQPKLICFHVSKNLVSSTVEEGVPNACIRLTMPHEAGKHYTCRIERRWHIPNKSPFPRLAKGLIVSNA